MKSEEIAVLRILYKHNGPIRLSNLLEGFPDRSKPSIMDAVSRLQLESYLVMIDSPAELCVTINRQVRKTVLNILESDSGQYNLKRIRENEILQSLSVQGISTQRNDCLRYRNSEVHNNGDVLLRVPKHAIKFCASLLVFSFVIVGVVSVIDPQRTAIESVNFGNGENALPFMFISTSPPADENGDGANSAKGLVGQVYESESRKVAYSGEPSRDLPVEGFITKLAAFNEPRLYYHYIISEKEGLVFLEPLVPAAFTKGINTSLSTTHPSVTDNQAKHVSLT